MDRGHARRREERRDDGAIEVVDAVECGHELVSCWELGEGWRVQVQIVHQVQWADDLHDAPGYAAVDVEERVLEARFAGWMPGEEPLEDGALCLD